MMMEPFSSDSLKDMREIRKMEDRNELLTKLEMKEFHKITGKVIWLADSTRSDLCFTALQMSKKNKEAIIFDLRDVKRVLKKVRECSNRLKYEKIGSKEDLMIVGMGDTFFKTDDKAVGGVFLLLTN